MDLCFLWHQRPFVASRLFHCQPHHRRSQYSSWSPGKKRQREKPWQTVLAKRNVGTEMVINASFSKWRIFIWPNWIFTSLDFPEIAGKFSSNLLPFGRVRPRPGPTTASLGDLLTMTSWLLTKSSRPTFGENLKESHPMLSHTVDDGGPEIRETWTPPVGCKKTYINNGRNYRPQLVQDFWWPLVIWFYRLFLPNKFLAYLCFNLSFHHFCPKQRSTTDSALQSLLSCLSPTTY